MEMRTLSTIYESIKKLWKLKIVGELRTSEASQLLGNCWSQKMRVVKIALLLTLAACSNSNEPSENEISQALEREINSVMAVMGAKATVTSMKKHECNEAGQGRVRCNITATVKNVARSGQEQTQTRSENMLFEKRGNAWAIVQ